MAHLLHDVLFPRRPPTAGSNQPPRAPTPPPPRQATSDPSAPASHRAPMRFQNPEVVFTTSAHGSNGGHQDVEDDEAESGAGFFDLNQPLDSDDEDDNHEPIQENGEGNFDEDVSSQPVVRFVGMQFDNEDVALKVYNEYAYKMGFGTRICSSKYSHKRGCEKVLINRVFECVHARKGAAAAATFGGTSESAARKQCSATDMSSRSKNTSHQPASASMEMSDSRQRNRVVRHNCKAHMIVSLREGSFTITTFTDEHTHPLVKELGRRRYYQSHRKILEEDLEFLELMHNRNLKTSDIMGMLGDVHGGDIQTLGLNIEKQASIFYTREVFDRFQKLIAKNTAFTLELQQNDVGLRFSLVASDRRDTRTYQVEADIANGLYECSCNMFDMCGLICPHIIRVMVHLNIQVIPNRYMLERWSEEANKGAPVPDANTRAHMFGIPGTNTLRYNRLCLKMNRLASDACFSDETYELVSTAIDNVSAVVDAKRRGTQHGDAQQEGEPDVVQVQAQRPQAQQQAAQGGLRNPPRQQPKGRPKESEKQKKPLLEQREDAAKKKKKGKKDEETNTATKTSTTAKRSTAAKKKKTGTKVKKCPFCLGDHHLVDCLVMKMKMSAAQEAQGAAIQQDDIVPEVELGLKL
ncbi:hypothetical protein ACQ4PT_060927 [Festuca glaucescens]